VGALTFFEPDRDRFPCLDLAIEAGRMGGAWPAAMNAANEVAVASFLEGRLPFPGIAHVVRDVLEKGDGRTLSSIEDVLAADQDARRTAEVLVDRYSAR
jgi:1-deoxy-D-xylulose-5-phosphate reductoisomerase